MKTFLLTLLVCSTVLTQSEHGSYVPDHSLQLYDQAELASDASSWPILEYVDHFGLATIIPRGTKLQIVNSQLGFVKASIMNGKYKNEVVWFNEIDIK